MVCFGEISVLWGFNHLVDFNHRQVDNQQLCLLPINSIEKVELIIAESVSFDEKFQIERHSFRWTVV